MAVTTIAALLLLSGLLKGAELLPGKSFSAIVEDLALGLGELRLLEGQDFLLLVFRILIVVYFWIITPLVILAIFRRADWRRRLRAMLLFSIVVAIFAMLLLRSDFARQLALDGALQLPQGRSGEATQGIPLLLSTPPLWLGMFASLLLAGLLIAVAWRVLRRGRIAQAEIELLAAEAQEAAQGIYLGRDLKDVVTRCYHEMSRILMEQRGMQRQAAMTPREFELRLHGTGLPDEEVRRLTRLFEAVRYGEVSPAEHQRKEALRCLTAIAQAARATR